MDGAVQKKIIEARSKQHENRWISKASGQFEVFRRLVLCEPCQFGEDKIFPTQKTNNARAQLCTVESIILYSVT